VNSNNKLTNDDYPYFLGSTYLNGYRARRITEMIESKDKISLDDSKQIHMDFKSISGLEFITILKTLKSNDPDIQLALKLLLDWDGYLTADTIGGTIYEIARFSIFHDILEHHIEKDLVHRLAGLGFDPYIYGDQEFISHDITALLRLLNNPDSWWIQTAGGKDAILSRGLKTSIQWLRKHLGKDVKNWKWGKIHRLRFPHPLGEVKPLDKIFNRGPFPIGGDTDTPFQTAMKPDEPFDFKSCGPTYRQILNSEDWEQSLQIYPIGQSGAIGSPNYDDWMNLWREGKYVPMLWSRERIEQNRKNQLNLKP
jgi:penicillin amidase